MVPQELVPSDAYTELVVDRVLQARKNVGMYDAVPKGLGVGDGIDVGVRRHFWQATKSNCDKPQSNEYSADDFESPIHLWRLDCKT